MGKKVVRTFSKNSDLIRERREKIAKTAAALFKRNGYIKTTTREIADACGISIGALYHYIASKEDILYLLSDHTFNWLKELAGGVSFGLEGCSHTEKLRITIGKYMEYVENNRDNIAFWYRETKSLTEEARKVLFDGEHCLVNTFEKLLAEGCKSGEFEVSDVTLAATNIVVLCDMWSFRRWFLKGRITLEKYIEIQTDFIIKSICKDKSMISSIPEPAG